MKEVNQDKLTRAVITEKSDLTDDEIKLVKRVFLFNESSRKEYLLNNNRGELEIAFWLNTIQFFDEKFCRFYKKLEDEYAQQK